MGKDGEIDDIIKMIKEKMGIGGNNNEDDTRTNADNKILKNVNIPEEGFVVQYLTLLPVKVGEEEEFSLEPVDRYIESIYRIICETRGAKIIETKKRVYEHKRLGSIEAIKSLKVDCTEMEEEEKNLEFSVWYTEENEYEQWFRGEIRQRVSGIENRATWKVPL